LRDLNSPSFILKILFVYLYKLKIYINGTNNN
jgi:hypothetical protein